MATYPQKEYVSGIDENHFYSSGESEKGYKIYAYGNWKSPVYTSNEAPLFAYKNIVWETKNYSVSGSWTCQIKDLTGKLLRQVSVDKGLEAMDLVGHDVVFRTPTIASGKGESPYKIFDIATGKLISSGKI